MKEELHQRLWSAQSRWLELKAQGLSKHDLKMAGLREHGDPAWGMRQVIFTGNTRVTYERVLKGFVEWCHERGIVSNYDIGKREMRDYVRHLIGEGANQSTLDKVRSACVKMGALYGKWESFHAMSAKLGAEIRELVQDGVIRGAEHQRITPEVADRAIERLRELDARAMAETGESRGYALAAELQRECGLRAIEATERMTAGRLLDGQVFVEGKGGRERTATLSPALDKGLRAYFASGGKSCLASLRGYESAWRRAVVGSGGRSTGTHALRRMWAGGYQADRYRAYVAAGMSPAEASEAAAADTLDALGHGRDRAELRAAYLGRS